jgi:hypothetical protein
MMDQKKQEKLYLDIIVEFNDLSWTVHLQTSEEVVEDYSTKQRYPLHISIVTNSEKM